ncbi:MAG: AmmeMemoRadiSam system protein B [Planctomycetota bacterium]|nr:AmmeMemoRadiSam system protein B [Planctomycetota bacterium]
MDQAQPAPDRQPPVFDPSAPHQQTPRLRQVRGFPAQHGEQVLLGLADARQISDEIVFTIPAAQVILPHMDGTKTIDEIVGAVGHGLKRSDLEMLIAQLDHAGLLEGPRFQAILQRVRDEYDSAPHLPPAGTANIADALVTQEKGEGLSAEEIAAAAPAALRTAMDRWMAQALEKVDKPSFDELPRAVIAPHLDYWRGWMNYAGIYGRMRVVDRPDRVVVLGTNHFGFGTGVVGCDKGFQSPLGVSELDRAFVDELSRHLTAEQSRQLFLHRYDHEREHSVELHIPWIQHVFADPSTGATPKVFGALVHDPAVNNGESYDNQGLGILPFIDAMKKAIAASPGTTLIVASADLSHVGSSFGDRTPIVGDSQESVAFRNKVVGHDREMIQLIIEGKAEELVASMAWQQNPTRWCSVGNIVAAMKITGAPSVSVLNYVMAGDQQGSAMVSSIAAAIA